MVSTLYTGARVKVVRNNGGFVRMVLLCAVMSGYIFASPWMEHANGALASVFDRASFGRTRSGVSSSRVILRNEVSVSGSMSSIK